MRLMRNGSFLCLTRAVGFGLAVFLVMQPVGAVSQERDVAIAPGFGLGGSVGVNQFGGAANESIGAAPGWEVFLSAGIRSGFFLRTGATFSVHDLPTVSPNWQYLSLFAEPRFVALGFSPAWAPFISGRIGRTTEKVLGPSWELRASGLSLSGGGGVMLRLSPQIAVEGGVILGRSRFDDYRFRGEAAWKGCLDGLDADTPLPVSISECAGSRGLGGVAEFCYPPYFPEDASNCSPPEIPYAGTGRTGNWLRTWIGVNLSFSSATSD